MTQISSEILTLTKVFIAIFIIILLKGFYSFFIKPCRQLKLYSNVPGSGVSFKLSASKEIAYWSNASKSNFKLDPNEPFSSSKIHELCFKYSNLRLFATNFLNKIIVILADPKIIGEYYKNSKYYRKQATRSFLRTLYTNHGIAGPEGERWKHQRKIISEAFHFENIVKTLPIIEETIKELLDKIEGSQGKEIEVNIIDEFQKITGEIIGRTFFGQHLNDYKINGRPLTLEFADLIIKNENLKVHYFYQMFGDIAVLFSPELRKLKRQTINFGEFCRQLLRDSIKKIERNELENANGRKGLLQILVEKNKTEKGLNEEELLANFITNFLAGMDTTSHFAAMVVYFLSQYPEVKARVMNDINSCWDGKSSITLETLQKMDYVHATLEETLRMAGPASGTFLRVALQDHFLNDIPVKRGTLIAPVWTPSMFNQEIFKDPCVFRPERWIKGSPFYERPSDPYTFIPFSAGSRNCIGQHMAMMEAKLLLCHFLNRFEFRLIEGYKLEMVVRFVTEPKDPLKFILSEKKK